MPPSARGFDVRVAAARSDFTEYRYRAPIKFGGVALDRVTLSEVTLTVEGRDGRRATGTAAMPLGNVWAFPSRTLGYAQTLAAMRQVAEAAGALYGSSQLWGHPVALTHALEPGVFALAARVECPEPLPALATLVAASPVDAALHDAYGKLHGASCYRLYGRDHLGHDLSEYLGAEFAGVDLDEAVTPTPRAELPLYHLVGALDPLTPAEVTAPVGDGLPETLGEWILRDGLTHLKIKLNGGDPAWDLARVAAVDRVAALARPGPWAYSLDFNEQCPGADALVAFLERLKLDAPAAFARVQYVEQPTGRDLAASRGQRLHAAAKLVPVVADEALVSLESLALAQEQGYTGVAFKACKGQSQTLLLAAAARRAGLFTCVQDLTCPGAALVHSAGLAAHLKGVAAIEANARQYCPAANAGWEARFPGLFTVRGGVARTAGLGGVGLGFVPSPLAGEG